MVLVVLLAGMLALAVSAPFLTRGLGRDAGYPLAAGFAAGGLVVATQAPGVLAGRPVQADLPWIPGLGVRLHLTLDGLALVFALLVLGVGMLVMTYSARYFAPDTRPGRAYGLLTLFAVSMLGLVLADDVLVLFVFWEITTVCSFFLIGNRGEPVAKPATRALLVTGLGGLALLAGLVLAGVVTGSFELRTILADPGAVRASGLAPVIGTLIVLGCLTKSAQVPFHFWLPGAMVADTPISAYLHAATMVKAGIYLLARFSPIFAGSPGWLYALVPVGLTTGVYAAAVALKQHDLKALLAYSTVSQLGVLVALIGVGTTAALAAAALHTLAHALFKATLFMLVGIIDEAGSRDIRDLSGLRRAMPATAAATGLAALSMAGVPVLVGFVSKEEALAAFLAAPGGAWLAPVATGLMVVASALTFAYGARIVHGAFGGEPLTQRGLYEPAWPFLAPAAVPAVAGLLLGPAAALLDPLVDRAVHDGLGRPGHPNLALWHGVTPALGLSMLIIAAGLTLFVARDPVDRAMRRARLPDRLVAIRVFDQAYDGVIRLGALVGRPALSSSMAPPLALPLAALVALSAVAVAVGVGAAGPPPSSPAADWVVVTLLAGAVGALVVARSRLAAVSLLGITGFVLVGWFLLLGAPDLALIQLLVETLTVVVVVLVIRRLPDDFPGRRGGRTRVPGRRTRRPGWRSALGAPLAVGVGLGAAAGTYLLTGRRGPSPPGEYYLSEAERQTGGRNVVNTILVDFRALDTLGEITVLGVVALGLAVLLGGRRGRSPARDERTALAAPDGVGDVVVRAADRLLGPPLVVLSAYLLLRGHDAPGGGFIGGLVAGGAVIVRWLARGPAAFRTPLLRAEALVGTGVAVAVAYGLGGLVAGPAFLAGGSVGLPLPPLGTVELAASLVFDVGVYLVVVGLVVAALDRLGRPPASREGLP